MSRVLSIRLDERTILGCYYLLQQTTLAGRALPASTAVARVIEASVLLQEERGVISLPKTTREVLAELDSYAPLKLRQTEDLGLLEVLARGVPYQGQETSTGEDDSTEVAAIKALERSMLGEEDSEEKDSSTAEAEAISRALAEVQRPQSIKGITMPDATPDKTELPTLAGVEHPWTGMRRLSPDSIEHRDPANKLWRAAIASKDNALIVAFQIAFAKFPFLSWRSDEVKEYVNLLMKAHNSWIEANPGKEQPI